MIFKTFQSELDGISNKIGFSKRSFAEWGKQVSTSFRESEGVVNSFKNALRTAFIIPIEKDNGWIKNNLVEIVTKENIDTFIPELDTDSARTELETLQNIQNKINETKGSWDDYNKQFQDGRKYLLDYAKQNNVLESSVDNVKAANQQARASALAHNEAIKAQTFSAKAGKVALQALAMAGNMLAMWAISKVITVFDNWIHNMDNAKEELEEANSKLEEVNSELEATASRIDELNAKENLTLVEAEELEKLKTTNAELERELRIREELAKVKGAKANKEALLYFNSTSGSFWESFFANLKDSITNFDFFGGDNLLFDTSPVFVDKVSEAEYYIEQAEKLKQKLAKITDKDSKDYKSTSAAIKK